jgi:hypothetical protein
MRIEKREKEDEPQRVFQVELWCPINDGRITRLYNTS